MQKMLWLISRISLLGLLIFEFLNWLDVLHWSLDFTWRGLVITLLVVWGIIEILNIYLKRTLSTHLPGFSVFIAVLGLYIDAAGDFSRLYSSYSWYDQLAHFIGGLISTYIFLIFFSALIKADKMRLGRFGLASFGLFASVFLGVLYELEEYFEDVLTGSNRLGSGPDTANDLFLGLVGALIAILIFLVIKYGKIEKSRNTI